MHDEVRGRGRRPRAALSRRVGILGGTFNPPHVGHLVCASEACAQLELERVVFVPTAVPPHKDADEDPGAEERLELCRAAVADDPRLAVSDIELIRGGPSYTVDTLGELHAQAPEDVLTFIVGGDMARSFASWREPGEVLRLAELGVAERRGARRDEIAAALSPLGAGDRITFFDMPRIDISSTDVRTRVAGGRSIRYLVPDAVADRIARGGLYR